MLLRISECIFVIISLLLVLSLIINKTYICHIKDNMKKSDYVAGIALLMALYVLCALITAILIPNIFCKIGLVFFALSPFIIGKMATYEKEKIYTAIQILSILAGSIFVLYFILL